MENDEPGRNRLPDNAYAGLGSQRRIREYMQAALAAAVLGVTLSLYVLGRQVPAELVAFAGGIIGWYFRDVDGRASRSGVAGIFGL